MTVTAPVVQSTGGLEIHLGGVRASGLARDYLAGSNALAPFYSGHPLDLRAYQRKVDEVAARLPSDARRAAARAIRPTSAAAAERLERIIAGEGVFVTTGQQAGLFGGPFYTVHKVLTAVRLARELEKLLRRPVAPLFWVAADDHDWAEVNHTFVLTAQNEVQRIQMPAEPDAPAHPVSRRFLGAEIDAVRAELTELLPASSFARPVRELLEHAYCPGRSMAEAFEELLAGLFAQHDLLLLNPAAPAVKELAAPILRAELERAEEHAALLARQAERLEAAGYHTQVTVSADAANVFFHDENGRDRLVREDGAWLLRRSKRSLTEAELFATLQSSPTSFSPNVLLRPIVESALVPTIAYVGGPAEISYFAQIGCLFSAHGIMPPVVVARFNVTLVEPKVRKVMDKFEMDVDAFARPFHEVAAQLVRDEMPAEVVRSLEVLRVALAEGYERLASAAELVDPTLRGWLEGLRNQGLSHTESAEKKIRSHLRKKSEIELEQLRKAAMNLFPDSAPQERMLNALPYLARYGSGLLDELLAAMTFDFGPPAEAWTGVRC
jgi:bacillithiol biosynthesis cysteine-adding enzyme BshC